MTVGQRAAADSHRRANRCGEDIHRLCTSQRCLPAGPSDSLLPRPQAPHRLGDRQGGRLIPEAARHPGKNGGASPGRLGPCPGHTGRVTRHSGDHGRSNPEPRHHRGQPVAPRALVRLHRRSHRRRRHPRSPHPWLPQDHAQGRVHAEGGQATGIERSGRIRAQTHRRSAPRDNPLFQAVGFSRNTRSI